MPAPELIAHRGYTLRYPENTLPAFEAAINSGARFLECDVQLTKDAVPVLFHDQTLNRLSQQSGRIHDYTHDELRKLYVHAPDRPGNFCHKAPIATLDELIDLLTLHPEVTGFFELKRSSLERFGVDSVVEIVLKHLENIKSNSVVISYNMNALFSARERGWPNIGAVIDIWAESTREDMHQLAPQYIFCDIHGLPDHGEISFPSGKIAVFEVIDSGIAVDLSNRGVDMIETFAIAEMLSKIHQNGNKTDE